jgi:hypothetical protein
MIIENARMIKQVKLFFYLGAGLWAISSLLLFLFGEDLYGFLVAGILLVWFMVFQFVDFQYIKFEMDHRKLNLRYYSVVKFGRKEYNTIEFPLENLYDYRMEKSVFGLVDDLILVIKTSRGVAEYPPVSMAALASPEQKMIELQLKMLLKR